MASILPAKMSNLSSEETQESSYLDCAPVSTVSSVDSETSSASEIVGLPQGLSTPKSDDFVGPNTTYDFERDLTSAMKQFEDVS